MNLEILKKKIEEYPNKKELLILPSISELEMDNFRITSALYSSDINLSIDSNVDTLQDVYNKIFNKYQVDPKLFNYPYFVTISLDAFDEKTIKIINSIDHNIPIFIVPSHLVDKRKIEMLSKITNHNCIFYLNSFINQDEYNFIAKKFKIDNTADPVLVIDKIDDSVIGIIEKYCEQFQNPRFRIEIKDKNSLNHLYDIIPYIPQNIIYIEIDDNLFDEKNPNNARDCIVEGQHEFNVNEKELIISFQGIKYESINQIFELEKNIQQIKSHIPSDAGELDIVTYVSLFIINYFKYDYDMYEKINVKEDFDDINLTQFISKGKGVCKHFASFTKYLLTSLNVECEEIDSMGDVYNNPDVEGHAFNVVKIDGKLYLLDNTWIAGAIQTGRIRTLPESTDFLTSNETFGHKDYEADIYYECETFDRNEINNSINRVLNWNKNYKIHPSALKDLFRKHILRQQKKMNVEERIERAIPRRK